MQTKLRISGLVAAVLLAACQAQGQVSLQWETNLEIARQQAAAANRLVLIHFSAPWCSACRKMEQEVFSHPTVQAAIAADYVPVQLNVDHNRPVSLQYGINRLPTDVVITPDGQLLERQPGFMERYQYISRLRQIADDSRRAPPVTAATRPTGSLPVTAQVPPNTGPYTAPAVPTWSNPTQPTAQAPSRPVAPIAGGPAPNPPVSPTEHNWATPTSPNPAMANQNPMDLHNGQVNSQPPTTGQPPMDYRASTPNVPFQPAPYQGAQAPATPEPSQPTPYEVARAPVAPPESFQMSPYQAEQAPAMPEPAAHQPPQLPVAPVTPEPYQP
ncbi:MAG: thioredoxin family protein, partial [Pirellulales bacterium]|nr:thioredoxin family protein [Pirellulales bacterium]